MVQSSIPHAFFAMAENAAEDIVYSQAQVDSSSGVRSWIPTTYRQAQEQVVKLANFLRSIGVKNGTKVAILSGTRPEWCIADLAILACGGVTISIYQSLPEDEVGYILFDSGAKIVFAENNEQVHKLKKLTNHPCPIPATEERSAQSAQIKIAEIIAFEPGLGDTSVHGLNTILSDERWFNPGAVTECINSIKPEDLAALVYTSGTTGPPKGVMQSHANHLANVRQAKECGVFAPDGELFLFLPLAHSFARLIAYVGLLTPARLQFPTVIDHLTSKQDPAQVARDIRESTAQVYPTVPRLLEKMRDGVMAATRQPGISGLLTKMTVQAAQKRYQAIKIGAKPDLLSELVYSGTAAIRDKIKRKLFGPKFAHAVSGGAKLPVDVCEFFEALGLPILEGYGLTETCVATNVNRPTKRRVGSVGPRIASDVEIKIAEDGEILFKGPNVTAGYYNRPLATKSQWDESGWFHTGDLGRLDPEGFLFITGRKKELIVTSGGKKIAAGKLEELLKRSPYISQAVACGEGQPFCVALITLNREAVSDWAVKQGQSAAQPFSTNSDVKRLIEAELANINSELASFETVKRAGIIDEEFTIDNGLMTPTFKVKRAAVIARYQALIDSLYKKDS